MNISSEGGSHELPEGNINETQIEARLHLFPLLVLSQISLTFWLNNLGYSISLSLTLSFTFRHTFSLPPSPPLISFSTTEQRLVGRQITGKGMSDSDTGVGAEGDLSATPVSLKRAFGLDTTWWTAFV